MREFDIYLSLSWSTRDSNDFGGQLLLLHSDSFLDSNLIERVHRVLNTFSDDATFVRLDADLGTNPQLIFDQVRPTY